MFYKSLFIPFPSASSTAKPSDCQYRESMATMGAASNEHVPGVTQCMVGGSRSQEATDAQLRTKLKEQQLS